MKNSNLGGANKNYLKENFEVINIPTKIIDNSLDTRGPYQFKSGAIY